MKKQKGITLIALVITIIVLLILAGVSISLIVGNNGILNQASTSVVKTREAEAKEEVSVAWASMETDYLAEWTNNTGLVKDTSYIKDKLDKYLAGTGEIVGELTYDKEKDTYTLTYKPYDDDLPYEMTISVNGKVNIVGAPSLSEKPGESESPEEGATSFSEITAENYGDYVDYEVDLGIAAAANALSDGSVPKTDWRIFYKSGDNVFLIASDYLPSSKFPNGVFYEQTSLYNGYWEKDNTDSSKLTTGGMVTTNNRFLFTKLSNVTTTNYNYQAVSTLLDSSKWSAFAKTGYVDDTQNAVIGSPTVEMWMASWNEKYSDTLTFDATKTGYKISRFRYERKRRV